MNDYVAYSIGWSGLGLVVGYVLGKTEVATLSLLERWRHRHDHA